MSLIDQTPRDVMSGAETAFTGAIAAMDAILTPERSFSQYPDITAMTGLATETKRSDA